MRVRPRIFLFCGVSLASIAATLWVFLVFLVPTENVTHVSFDELTADVAAGRVREIRIASRLYTYDARDASEHWVKKQASGPQPDIARVRALLSARDVKPPRISFEP